MKLQKFDILRLFLYCNLLLVYDISGGDINVMKLQKFDILF